jgi:hypothetical protein
MNITASNPRPSTTIDNEGAFDVDVTVDGVEGEVTLAPCQYDGSLAVYGNRPDHWMTGALLASLRKLPDGEFRAACDAIEAAAIEVC